MITKAYRKVNSLLSSSVLLKFYFPLLFLCSPSCSVLYQYEQWLSRIQGMHSLKANYQCRLVSTETLMSMQTLVQSQSDSNKDWQGLLKMVYCAGINMSSSIFQSPVYVLLRSTRVSIQLIYRITERCTSEMQGEKINRHTHILHTHTHKTNKVYSST